MLRKNKEPLYQVVVSDINAKMQLEPAAHYVVSGFGNFQSRQTQIAEVSAELIDDSKDVDAQHIGVRRLRSKEAKAILRNCGVAEELPNGLTVRQQHDPQDVFWGTVEMMQQLDNPKGVAFNS